MALPEDTLASSFIPAAFTGGRALPISSVRDFEMGGIAFNDPSQGHLYQIWQARILDNEQIEVSSQNSNPVIVYAGTDITEVSLTFDQNMRPALAFVEQGNAKLRWFDGQVGSQVVTNFGSSYKSPRIALDDKRPTQMGTNDIILAYLRNGNLYHRRQRDRFQNEILLSSNVQSPGIIKIGMNRVNRFQFLLRWP